MNHGNQGVECRVKEAERETRKIVDSGLRILLVLAQLLLFFFELVYHQRDILPEVFHQGR